MHDPSVVVFDLKWPLPTWRQWRRRKLWVGGKVYRSPLVTVWHEEPQGRDSGTVCKGMGGSDLTLHNVAWAWRHRAHLRLQWSLWQQFCRRAWTRCAECGQPFRRHQAVFSHGWDDRGPGWKVAESGRFHDKCSALVTARMQRDEFREALQVLNPTKAQLAPPMDSTAAWRVTYALRSSVSPETGP